MANARKILPIDLETSCVMTSLTVENYLKAILQIELRVHSKWVSTGQLADAVHVLPGTVTSMLKTLAESGLANYRPYEGVTLTNEGRLLALRMLRRHRLIELFLVQTLSLTWDQVHEEAENMEHSVSDFLVDHIDNYLGHPPIDPHGDPIPSANGDMRADTGSAVTLASCGQESRVRIVRVMRQEPEFLRYLSRIGLELGVHAIVNENNLEAGIVNIQFGDHSTSLGHQAAAQLMVERIET